MKGLKSKEIEGYAMAFVSFALPKIEKSKEIILFGSAARGEAGKESDIDIFFDVNREDEEVIKNILKTETEKFYKSRMAEPWQIKGIKNEIKVSVGMLSEWKLKRSIISDGIVLYGKYREMPEKMKGFMQFNVNPIKDISKRNRIIRKLFGRKEKGYSVKGVVKEGGGKKLSASSFIVPSENASKIITLLKKEKIIYKFFELWTDQIS